MISEIAGSYLDPTQIADLSQQKSKVFEKFDSDGNGSFSSEEISAFAEDLSGKVGHSVESKDVIAKLDANEDGEVSQDEFTSIRPDGPPPKMRRMQNRRQARRFRTSNLTEQNSTDFVDKNGDGIDDNEQTETQLNFKADKYANQSAASFLVNSTLNQLI